MVPPKWIGSRQHGITGGRTDSRWTVRIRKKYPLLRQAVRMRCRKQVLPVAGKVMVPQIIRHHENHVRPGRQIAGKGKFHWNPECGKEGQEESHHGLKNSLTFEPLPSSIDITRKNPETVFPSTCAAVGIRPVHRARANQRFRILPFQPGMR